MKPFTSEFREMPEDYSDAHYSDDELLRSFEACGEGDEE